MKRKKLVFKKNTISELNEKSLFTINGGTLSMNQDYQSEPPKPPTSISGPACTM